MKILALDCATKTGWAVIDDGKIVASGVSDLSEDKDRSYGWLFICFRIWLAHLCWVKKPDVIVYEKAHHRGEAATQICVNLTGLVQEVGAQQNIPVRNVMANTLKKFATGNGKASKAEMVEAAQVWVDKDITSNDEADAIHLARWGHKHVTL